MTEINLLIVVICVASCFFAGMMGYRQGFQL